MKDGGKNALNRAPNIREDIPDAAAAAAASSTNIEITLYPAWERGYIWNGDYYMNVSIKISSFFFICLRVILDAIDIRQSESVSQKGILLLFRYFIYFFLLIIFHDQVLTHRNDLIMRVTQNIATYNLYKRREALIGAYY